MDYCYIYLFKQKKTPMYKIGISHDIKKRVYGLTGASGREIRVIASRECENEEQARIIEKQLHKKYGEFRTRGEWFIITNKYMLRTLINEYNKSNVDNGYKIDEKDMEKFYKYQAVIRKLLSQELENIKVERFENALQHYVQDVLIDKIEFAKSCGLSINTALFLNEKFKSIESEQTINRVKYYLEVLPLICAGVAVSARGKSLQSIKKVIKEVISAKRTAIDMVLTLAVCAADEHLKPTFNFLTGEV